MIGLIPQQTTVLTDIEVGSFPTSTFQAHIEQERIFGRTDGIEAVKQAIYFILCTERYKYPIYNWNYGVELSNLIGTDPEFAIPEIERVITEALMQDDRIVRVHTFDFNVVKKVVSVRFMVDTVYGQIPTETEVNI